MKVGAGAGIFFAAPALQKVQLRLTALQPWFLHEGFEQNFYHHVPVYLVLIWTNKNTDEKTHTFSWRGKYVRKRTKN